MYILMCMYKNTNIFSLIVTYTYIHISMYIISGGTWSSLMLPVLRSASYTLFRNCHLQRGGVRIHPENAHTSGLHGVQYVAQCVAGAALTLVIWQ